MPLPPHLRSSSPARVRFAWLPRLAKALVFPLALAACADQPNEPHLAPAPDAPALAAFRCTAQPRAGVVACRLDAPSTGAASGELIVGGQGQHVQLSSSAVSYDSTGRFAAFVTVANLLPQPMGTTDGTTLDPEGIRVFFAEGPTVVDGSGSVTVANADSVGVFTATGQPFFRYAQILAPGDTSKAREWVFTVPLTVIRFEFVVYVAAPVPFEQGWIDVASPRDSLAPGDTVQLSATVRGPTGRALSGQSVSWTSSDDSVGTVSPTGLFMAVRAGTVTITATSGPRTGAATLVVVTPAAVDSMAPELTSLSVSPDTVIAGADSAFVTVTVGADDPGSGVQLIEARLRSPSGTQTGSCTATLSTGTTASGTWTCSVVIAPGSEAGTWTVSQVHAEDALGNARVTHSSALEARGYETTFQVQGG